METPPPAEEESRVVRNNVDAQSTWIREDEHDHELAASLRAGVVAMRKAALMYKFMWPNPGEMEQITVGGGPPMGLGRVSHDAGSGASMAGLTDTLYALRINRSDLPNPWADSIRSTARLPFRSRVVFSGWDEELMGKSTYDDDGSLIHREPGWVDRLTAEGQSFDQYAQETFEDGLFEGIAFSFIDNDPRKFPDPESRRAAGARPWVTKFLRRDIRRITLEFRNGMPRLKQVVLVQPISTTDVSDPNSWVETCVDARKVVTAGDPDADPKIDPDARKVRTQIFVPDPKKPNEWVEEPMLRSFIVPDDPRDELLDIPLVPHYTNRVSAFRGRSPFLDSAWTEASIWNHNSELSSLAREASITFIHQTGVDIDGQTKKPVLQDTRGMRFYWSTKSDGTFSIVETKGSALQSIMGLVDWKIKLLEKAHHQIQVEKPTGPVTAREITLEGVQASSALEMWTIYQEQAWQKICELMALLGGLQQRGVVRIPHDFGLPNTGMERNHSLFVSDHMSPTNYWQEAVRAGDVDEQSFNLKAELAWAEKNASPPGSATDSGLGLNPTAAFVST